MGRNSVSVCLCFILLGFEHLEEGGQAADLDEARLAADVDASGEDKEACNK